MSTSGITMDNFTTFILGSYSNDSQIQYNNLLKTFKKNPSIDSAWMTYCLAFFSHNKNNCTSNDDVGDNDNDENEAENDEEN